PAGVGAGHVAVRGDRPRRQLPGGEPRLGPADGAADGGRLLRARRAAGAGRPRAARRLGAAPARPRQPGAAGLGRPAARRHAPQPLDGAPRPLARVPGGDGRRRYPDRDGPHPRTPPPPGGAGMIGASRRRSAPAAAEPFRLHQRLSRRAAWQRRLLHASLAALAVAAVTLFLPLDLAGRVSLVALGAVAGLAWPLRSREPAALRSIREQTGLSYETALTVLERAGTGARPAEADPYGLERAVVERAQQAVKAYRSEASPPWWLPALLVAAVLVALPVLGPLAGGPSARGGGQAAGGAVSEPSAPEAGEAPEPAAPEPPTPGRAEA